MTYGRPTSVKCEGGKAWYYEDDLGLDIVIEVFGYGPPKYVHVWIPWAKLRAAISRAPKPKRKKSA